MTISRITWINFLLAAAISLLIWGMLSYPQLAFNHFTIDRAEALKIAQDYLRSLGETPESFQSVVIFENDERTNRYLQRTIGFDGLRKFLKENDYIMFYWIVRFYKVKQKDEYRFTISAATGEINTFRHIIEDSAARPIIERDQAREKAVAFLANRYGFNPENFSQKGDLKNQLDNRVDYAFSWYKSNVSIPWSTEENSGTAKLIQGVTVSGPEVLSFFKYSFDIPEKFNRNLSLIMNIGSNIGTIIRIIYYVLITAAIYFIVVRRDHLVMHTTKKFYLWLAFSFILISVAAEFNLIEELFFNYPTTQPFNSYAWRVAVNSMVGIIFFSVTLLIPSLAGELLHHETMKERKEGTFLHYIRTTFLSRNVTRSIFLGYLVFLIMLGIQSLLIKFGQKYWGVWIEYNLISHLSTAYLPFLVSFTLGFMASINEEILYSLFFISWGVKLFKNVMAAAFVSSLIWGFAHSNYPVYPSWFRGIEVTCLGFFLSFVYLRYGLITVIIGHFLFDVFWNSAAYLFGQTNPFYFYSSLSMLLLPLAFGFLAYIVNKKENLQPMRWHLNKHQLFNLEVLKTFLSANKDKFDNRSPEEIRRELIGHGWDVAVVEDALVDIYHMPLS